jgi:hypothetical protein
MLSSAIVFVYSYFFIVRPEHIHDFRGSQLAETDALAAVFATQQADGFSARQPRYARKLRGRAPYPADAWLKS